MAVEVSDLVAYLGLDDSPFDLGMARAERRMDQGAVRMRASMATIGQAAMSVGFGIGRELVRGLEAVVQPAMLFEQTMSGVQAVSGATAAQMQRLSDLALQLGKDTTFSAAQAAAGIEELIKGGVSVTDVMNGAAKATLNLAAAGGVDLASAAEIAANALNMFSLSGSQMAHVVDEIAGAANASSLSVQDFRYSLAYAGTTAKGLHVSFDDLAVAIAELGQAGIKGSSAGTGLRAVMTALSAPTRAAASEMYRLGIITAQGKNRLFDAQGQMKRLADVQEILKTSLKGMTDQQQTAALTLIFGRQAARVAGIMAEDGAAKFDKMATAMGKVTAQSVAAQRLNNLAGDITNLSGTVETLTIRLGEAFGGGQGMPLFRQMVQAVNSVVQGITGWVQAHGPLLARLGPLAAAVGAVTAGTLAMGGAFTVVLATINPLTVALGGLLSAGALVALAWEQNWGGIQQSVQRAWTGMQPALQALGGAAGGTTAAFQRGGLGAAWGVGFSQFQTLFSRFTNWMAGEALPDLRRQLDRWRDAFADWVLPAIPQALGYLGQLKDRTVAWIQQEAPVFVQNLGRWRDAFTTWAQGAWTAAQPDLRSFGNQIIGWMNSATETIKKNTQKWADAFAGWLEPSKGQVQDQMDAWVNSLDDWVNSKGVQAMINLGNALADALVAAIVAKLKRDMSPEALWRVVTSSAPFRPTGGGLLGAVAPGIEKYETPPWAPGGALYQPPGAKKKAWQKLGEDTMSGLTGGLVVGGRALQETLSGILDTMHRQALITTESHSPSRVYMRLGQDMMAGLALGISGQQAAVAAALGGVLGRPAARPFGTPAVAGLPAGTAAAGGLGAGSPVINITINGHQVIAGGNAALQRSEAARFGRAIVALAEQFDLATQRAGAGAPVSVAGGRT